jgi:Arc/MetJ family transcription regulator
MPMETISCYTEGVRRTTLEIDEDILSQAREILGTKGVKDTVEEALREAGERLIELYKEYEDLHNPEIMERAWPPPPIS